MLALLTNAQTQTQSFIANINWAQPSWDLFIILFFLVAALLYGLSLGRNRIIVILVSIYMALAVTNAVPFLGNIEAEIGINQLFVFKITSFVSVFIILFFLLSRSALMRTIATSDAQGKIWQVVLFSILHVGLLISIVLSFLPPQSSQVLAPLTRKIFVQDLSRFLWIVAPIIAMILIRADKESE